MGSILAACTRPNDCDRVLSAAARLAALTSAETHLAIVDGAGPNPIRGPMRATAADLVVLAPQVLSGTTTLSPDRSEREILIGAGVPVLVVRSSVEWTLRRILILVRRTGGEQDALAPALEWADWLGTPGRGEGSEGEPAEVQVLHVAENPAEMYSDGIRLRDQMERHTSSMRISTSPRLLQCIRFGASPERRVARWIAQLGADLLILRRPGAGSRAESFDGRWLSMLGSANCPVLVLPPP